MNKKFCDLCEREIEENDVLYLEIYDSNKKPKIQKKEICAWCLIEITKFLHGREK